MMLAYQERDALAEGKGPLAKASNEEPVFILRGKDKFAPQLVQMWVALMHQYYNVETPKIAEVRKLAQLMREWQAIYGSKVPD